MIVHYLWSLTLNHPLNLPTFDDISPKVDTTKAIPPLPDYFVTWPGKEQGKPKQPVFWIELRAKS